MSKSFTAQTAKTDIYASVTDSIIELIESGLLSGGISWNRESLGLPASFKSKKTYNGANVLILWAAAAKAGFSSNYWLTFKQAKDLGGMVRKGEKGTTIFFYSMVERENRETGNTDAIPCIKTFSVFNVEQIDGLHIEAANKTELSIFEQNEKAEFILRQSGANITEQGQKAFYQPSSDRIVMPSRELFKTEHDFYAVQLHELTHWTAHPSRLNRDFATRFGNEAYAFEELIAELGAAFLSAETGIISSTLEGHASYLQSWLKVLKNDKKAIFTAASQASKAANYIMDLAYPERASIESSEAEAAD